jgi:hypothetical protein
VPHQLPESERLEAHAEYLEPTVAEIEALAYRVDLDAPRTGALATVADAAQRLRRGIAGLKCSARDARERRPMPSDTIIPPAPETQPDVDSVRAGQAQATLALALGQLSAAFERVESLSMAFTRMIDTVGTNDAR